MTDVLRFPSAKQADPSYAEDAGARADALDPRSSCIVEAPAGSGKTGLLVQRFLKLLGDDTVEQPEEVLAITFTNKATAELRERVLQPLHAVQGGSLYAEASGFDGQTRMLAEAALARSICLGWGLLDRPSRLNIRSIDSVCAKLANAQPLLSRGTGNLQPVNDAEPLYRMAARRTLLQLGGADGPLHDALRTVLLHRDGNLRDCEMLLADMLKTREQWGELVPLSFSSLEQTKTDPEVRQRLERSLESIVCAGLSRALNTLPAGVLEELTTLAAQMAVEPGYKGGESPISSCVGKSTAPRALVEHLDHWLALIGLVLKPDGEWRKRHSQSDMKFMISNSAATQLKHLVQRIADDGLKGVLAGVLALPPVKYPDDQWTVTQALFHVLRRALIELRLLFAERGECDFAELALAARAALRAEEGSSDLALSAGGKLRHLLVDEMQDTSSGQYELIELLTRSWDGRSQTLFLVGDPKQSIYLFRQARVERFLRTMNERRLGDIELQPLQLKSNFRSQAALVKDLNVTFDVLFPRPDQEPLQELEGVDVPFVEAKAGREQTGDKGMIWHTTLFAKDDPRTGHAAREARVIRRIIEHRLTMPRRDRHDTTTKPSRIAILGRARSHLTAVIAELKCDYGNGPLPFRAVDLDTLGELPEVLDALALTRALLHPSDRIAWLAVLHAPWCGLGLADLLRLTGEGVQADAWATIASLVSKRRHHLTQDGIERLDRAWPVLETAVATIGRTSLATHVERTWLSLGGDAALSDSERTNVMRYLHLLRELEKEGGSIDAGLLSARLKKLYAEPDSGTEENGNYSIELMTIHKAKGLEWDIVLVPGLERSSGRPNSELLNWLEFDGMHGADNSASVVLAPIWQKGEDADKLSKWLSSMHRRREAAERKRVFYVAATRAREELHLFAATTITADGELALPPHGSLLSACWPAAAAHFDLHPAEQSKLQEQFIHSHDLKDAGLPPLDLAASGENFKENFGGPPVIQRLPLSFDPSARFRQAEQRRLDYPPAVPLRRTVTFERPEGSFTARAFGNVVHRYLEMLATRMKRGTTPDRLVAELTTWEPRLIASLRGEGIPPSLARKEARRAALALTLTLNDPVGLWILNPHKSSASESMLTNVSTSLRIDRTFIAGQEPLSDGEENIWIIDFKTTEQGSRSEEEFSKMEIGKYAAQLESYAAFRRTLPDGHLPIKLGLFYPLVPRLIHWRSIAKDVLSPILSGHTL